MAEIGRQLSTHVHPNFDLPFRIHQDEGRNNNEEWLFQIPELPHSRKKK
jgi:hypothetical protein